MTPANNLNQKPIKPRKVVIVTWIYFCVGVFSMTCAESEAYPLVKINKKYIKVTEGKI